MDGSFTWVSIYVCVYIYLCKSYYVHWYIKITCASSLQHSIKKEGVNISSMYGYHVMIRQMYTLYDTQFKGNIYISSNIYDFFIGKAAQGSFF